MTAITTLGTVALNNNILWEDRWSFHPIEQTATRTLGGALVLFAAQLIQGRPITLVSAQDQGWLNLAQVQAVQGLASNVLASYPLTIVNHSDPLVDQHFASGWVATPPWALAGLARIDGSQGGSVALTAPGIIDRDGSRYAIDYRVISHTAGTVQASIPGGVGAAISSEQVVREVITADTVGGTGDLVLTADATANLVIDYVTVRKIVDETFTVKFRHEDPPAFNAVPLIPRQSPRPGDYFTGTIKLITV